MKISCSIQNFRFAELPVLLAVPDAAVVKESYEEQKINNRRKNFPYWAKLWPSAIALCEFIAEHNLLVKNKRVFEIAGGLGLPSLFCARYASHIIYSDYAEDALVFVQHSISLNKIKNIEARLFNWNGEEMVEGIDVLLLSDINYEPGAFAALYKLINRYLEKGVSILISTPQRLMAKPFIEQLLPFCVEKTTIPVKNTNEMVEIFIMRLEKRG